MKKLLVLLFVLLTASVYAQDRGLQVIANENLGNSASIGKQYALFIAIDAYRSWTALKKPVADAREIRDILKRDYYIDEIIELYNQQATRANIARTFTDLQAKLGVHDSLFIYYAGHGHFDKSSNAGFWIPVDGGVDRFNQENWLPNSQIRGYISNLKTIHVFMVSDACFSGDILNTTRSMPPQIDNAYYRKAYALTSRQVLTSGSSEEVPDQSEFSAALINCLRKNTASLLDPFSIYNDVRLSIKRTTPLYGTLNSSSHQDGATFLFFKRNAAQPKQNASAVIDTSAAVGNIAVTSDIAGVIIIDGKETGTRIKAGGTVTVNNVSTGATEIAVKTDDGKITKAPQTVMVRQGQTATAAITAPVPAGFVRINGGTFTMGSPANEVDRVDYEGPQHQVTVSSFSIGKYPVTVMEFRRFVNATGYKTEAEKGDGGYVFIGSEWERKADANWKNPYFKQDDNHPVVMVSWNDAVQYCNWLSSQEKLTPAYSTNGTNVTLNRSANGYRLPTEAEWEYACRAGTTTPFSTGNNITTSQANYNGNYPYNNNAKGEYRNKTTPVGSFAANACGLYDMHGNVWEWCWDWCDNYPNSAQTDPTGAISGSYRVMRGGSWLSDGQYLRSACRGSGTPSRRSGYFGFRLVRP